MPFFRPASILSRSYSTLVDGDVFQRYENNEWTTIVAVAFDRDDNGTRWMVRLSGAKAFTLCHETFSVRTRSLRYGVISGLNNFLSVKGFPSILHDVDLKPGVLFAGDGGAHIVVASHGETEFRLLSVNNWTISPNKIRRSSENWVGYQSWRLVCFDDFGNEFAIASFGEERGE